MASRPRVDGAAWYQVLRNGRHLTWVQSQTLNVHDLLPGTEYKVSDTPSS
ncbi:hypothetical protein [Streptomyces sp. CB00455]|nr:hypothetical protein [Streptomyces sp. CB00455]